MRPAYFPICLAVLTLALPSGCSNSGPRVVEVRGTVTYAGKPVTQGRINFMPVSAGADGTNRPAIGAISKDGSYELRAFPGRNGASPGDYLVSVLSYTGSFVEGTAVHLVPKRFSEPQHSGLKATVPADREAVTINFDLRD